MTAEKLFHQIDVLMPEALQFLKDICEIESPTWNKAQVDRVGAFIAEKARKQGWKVEMDIQNVSGNVYCITMNPDAEGVPVALSGHMDTVHEVGSFGPDPVREDGDKLYGPGTIDCKGGIAAAYLAMRALDELHYTARPVQLLLQSDEENSSVTSGKATMRYICEKAKNACAFLNLEGNAPGFACVGRKGILRYRLDVTGVEVHACNSPNGVNAIADAACRILEIEKKMKDLDGLTSNVGKIHGGTAENTVPKNCSFTVDIRFASHAQMEEAQQYLKEIAQKEFLPGSTCTLTRLSYRPPMERVDRNLNLLSALNKIWENNGLDPLKDLFRAGGSDAADVTEYGIPCIDSLGVAGGSIHSRQEFADIPSLGESARRLSLAVLHL